MGKAVGAMGRGFHVHNTYARGRRVALHNSAKLRAGAAVVVARPSLRPGSNASSSSPWGGPSWEPTTTTTTDDDDEDDDDYDDYGDDGDEDDDDDDDHDDDDDGRELRG